VLERTFPLARHPEAGEFREREPAERAASKLRQHLPPVPAWPALHEGAYRVTAGPLNDRPEADTAARRIRERLRIKTRLLFRKPRGRVVLPRSPESGPRGVVGVATRSVKLRQAFASLIAAYSNAAPSSVMTVVSFVGCAW
jgi:hypothetical protein